MTWLLFLSFPIGALLGWLAGRAMARAAASERSMALQTEKARLEERTAAQMAELASAREREASLLERLKTAESDLSADRARLSQMTGTLEAKAHEIVDLGDRLQVAERAASGFQKQAAEAQNALTRVETQLSEERRLSAERSKLLDTAREEFAARFKALAEEILEDKSKRFTDRNAQQIEGLLKPLRDQLKDFDRKVSDGYEKETQQRVSLTREIEALRQLNQKIGEEAVNLTHALVGDKRIQGNWGEIQIERIFELSGLQKGRGYDAQKTIRTGDEGEPNRGRPDFIVHLPEGREVIVDSKVSLVDYHRYVGLIDDTARVEALDSLVAAVEAHVEELSSREYHRAQGLNSLEYVLMCIPIEPAYMAALNHSPELAPSALKKGILIVSPTTLLHTLQIISAIWRADDQSRNAQEIARAAGLLHDKFVGFIEDVGLIEKRIDGARESLDAAQRKLFRGPGNLVRRVDKLRVLGATTNKKLPASFDADDGEAEPAAIPVGPAVALDGAARTTTPEA